MPLMQRRSEQMSFAWRIFVCGALFLVGSVIAPSAMPINVYGPAAFDIDAETWALGHMVAAGAVMLGVSINGRWRWSPALRILGHGLFVMLFTTLGVSGLFAPHGIPVAIYGLSFFASYSISFLRCNVVDLIARWQAYE